MRKWRIALLLFCMTLASCTTLYLPQLDNTSAPIVQTSPYSAFDPLKNDYYFSITATLKYAKGSPDLCDDNRNPLYSETHSTVINAIVGDPDRNKTIYDGAITAMRIPLYNKPALTDPGFHCRAFLLKVPITLVPWTRFDPRGTVNIAIEAIAETNRTVSVSTAASNVAGILSLFTSGGNPIVAGLTKAVTDNRVAAAQDMWNKYNVAKSDIPEELVFGAVEIQSKAVRTVTVYEVKNGTSPDPAKDTPVITVTLQVNHKRSIFVDDELNGYTQDALPKTTAFDAPIVLSKTGGNDLPDFPNIVQRLSTKAPTLLQEIGPAAKDAGTLRNWCDRFVVLLKGFGLTGIDQGMIAHAVYSQREDLWQRDTTLLNSPCIGYPAVATMNLGDIMRKLYSADLWPNLVPEVVDPEIDFSRTSFDWRAYHNPILALFQSAARIKGQSEIPADLSATLFAKLQYTPSVILENNLGDLKGIDVGVKSIEAGKVPTLLSQLEYDMMGCHIEIPVTPAKGPRGKVVAFFKNEPKPVIIEIGFDDPNAGKGGQRIIRVSDIQFRRYGDAAHPDDQNLRMYEISSQWCKGIKQRIASPTP